MKKIFVLMAALLATGAGTAHGIELFWGLDIDIGIPRNDPYSGFDLGLYPVLGLEGYLSGSFALRSYIYGGGGLGVSSELEAYGTYGFGCNVEAVINSLVLGVGYGGTGATLDAAGGSPSAVLRLIAGLEGGGRGETAWAIKVYSDYNYTFKSRSKVGFLISLYMPFTSKPAPYRPGPTPKPAPAPQPEPAPVYVDNEGTVFYSYDGTGYVYLGDGVFYRCSDGAALGYTENGVLYAFDGRHLGFYEDPFIYDRNGNPVGADDPKALGKDASAKKQVSKAGKQYTPVKQPHGTVTKPRLKHGYFDGSLRDVF